MAKRYEYVFEVEPESWGHFPLDMLRYDRCWPARETDSFNIRQSVLDGRPMATIQLRGQKTPEVARWKSFGWDVVYEADKQVVA